MAVLESMTEFLSRVQKVVKTDSQGRILPILKPQDGFEKALSGLPSKKSRESMLPLDDEEEPRLKRIDSKEVEADGTQSSPGRFLQSFGVSSFKSSFFKRRKQQGGDICMDMDAVMVASTSDERLRKLEAESRHSPSKGCKGDASFQLPGMLDEPQTPDTIGSAGVASNWDPLPETAFMPQISCDSSFELRSLASRR
eukprot:TRINITY_DN6959_c0_g1_i1.p1 TRINITY_DN6959_c0_g1~~TRINITY_DN6959_c0_g1_i1.p1  ORF type:complete len:197 (-),score=49.24 TRINITY_DN6959_c0_g1_i1:10-600(-)